MCERNCTFRSFVSSFPCPLYIVSSAILIQCYTLRRGHRFSSPVTPRLLQTLILNDLNPVVVWVEDKRDILHSPVREPLLPVHILVLEPLARRIEVVDADADVAESLRLRVAVVVLEVLILSVTLAWWAECRSPFLPGLPFRCRSSMSAPIALRDQCQG